MVFYLKYRPAKIAELDSKELREKLNLVLGQEPESIPHAFLFTGPKGLGKTSTARIVAKAINCTNRKKGVEPCNTCSSCISISNGSNLDVLEIDAASNRGIDEIRDLREKIRLSPASSLKKVYIIDEVHMLTTEAFNALLKTLEEPPAHAQFILCTTEPQKIPQTILSRCFHIKFPRATNEDLVHSFERIAKAEDLKTDKDALSEIAKLSDGSFRDGAKILEELSIFSDKITKELIDEKYKTGTISTSIDSLIAALEQKEIRKGIKIVEELGDAGIDFKLFLESLIDRLHERLLKEVDNNQSASETKKLIELLAGAHSSIKYAVMPQLPLELAIVEWGAVEEVKEELVKEEAVVVKDVRAQSESPVPLPSEHGKILSEVIDKIKKDNFSVAGVLRGVKVESFEKKSLILSTNFRFHKEKLNEPKTLNLIREALREVTGSDVNLSIILK